MLVFHPKIHFFVVVDVITLHYWHTKNLYILSKRFVEKVNMIRCNHTGWMIRIEPFASCMLCIHLIKKKCFCFFYSWVSCPFLCRLWNSPLWNIQTLKINLLESWHCRCNPKSASFVFDLIDNFVVCCSVN